MSSINAPFGLRPSFHPTGLDRAVALSNGIASAYNTGILKGQPVALNTSGNIIAATAGSAFQGAFAGHEYTDLTGRRIVSNQWIANTAYQTGSEVTYYYADPTSFTTFRQMVAWLKLLLATKQTLATFPLVLQPLVCRNAPSLRVWRVRAQ
jgi:hypothetical protein